MKDNPRLNSRDPRFSDKPSKVVLLDPDGFSLERLAGSKLLETRRLEDVFLVTQPGLKTTVQVKHLMMATGADGNFPLSQLLSRLRENGIHSLFVEAGAHTASSFFKQALVDRLYVFVAPKLLGKGLGWTSGLEIASLDQAVRLTAMHAERLEDDLLISARPRFG